jgi:serine/threonine-protein kinase
MPDRTILAAIEDRYRIERELGQGGMATVYLARDVRHERGVALKVLRSDLAAVIGAERFLQEIRTTANLQHPHILPLHDSGEVDGTVFYVMPFVQGESLRDCLTRERQLPLDDALRITREVASALDYAHRHGVIHRDIKPENILLHDGQALVADFGIALAASRAEGGTRMTETGMSLGTPHYMSPEQALGERTIDARADIYALGCVAYEMLTGEPPFTGATVQAIVAKVMSATPERPSLIRSTVPEHVEAALLKALAKLPADRFRTAADFAAALDTSRAHPSAAVASATVERSGAVATPGTTDSRWSRFLPWGIAAAAIVVAGVTAWRGPRESGPVITRAIVPLELRDPPNVPLNELGTPFDLSPDGRLLVYVGADPDSAGETALWLRRLDRLEATPISGTRGAHSPQISHDGQRVLFLERRTAPDENTLRVIGVGGGVARTPAPAGSGLGRSWSPDGAIVVRGRGGFRRYNADGGSAGDSIGAARVGTALNFRVAPTGREVAMWSSQGSRDSIFLRRFESEQQTSIGEGTSPRFIDERRLAYRGNDGTLYVVPIDLASLSVTGPPVPLLEGVGTSGARQGLYASGRDGTLVYASGATIGLGHLVWVDRAGVEQRAGTVESAVYGSVALSPDDRRVAVSKGALFVGASDVWVIDLAQGSAVPVTSDGQGTRPVWSIDGKSLIYPSGVAQMGLAGRRVVVQRPADGSARVDTVLRAGVRSIGEVVPSPDGRHLAFRITRPPQTTRDIYYSRIDAPDSATIFAGERFQERSPRFSPDGKWLAYVSDRSGRDEIYVEAFPQAGGRVSISTDGGREPVWSRDGSEIFYRAIDGFMMGARLATGGTPEVVRRERLFQANRYLSNQFLTMYDVARDGRLLMIKLEQQAGRTDLVLVRNWGAEVDSAFRARR